VAPQPQPQVTEPDWDVDEEFTLTEDDDWRHLEFDLEKWGRALGVVKGDGHVYTGEQNIAARLSTALSIKLDAIRILSSVVEISRPIFVSSRNAWLRNFA